MRIMKIMGAIVPLFLLVACGGEGGPTDASAPPAATPTPEATATSPDAVAERFVSGLANTTVDGQRALVALTAPSSPARAYINHLVAFTEAETAAGAAPAAGTFNTDGGPGTFTACSGDPADPHPCATFSAFEYDGGGLLSGFALDGAPVRSVVAAGGPAQNLDGVTVQPLSAYHDTANGTVVVAYRVTNGTARTVNMAYNSAELVSGGTQHGSAAGLGPDTLPPSVAGVFLNQFNAPSAVGTLQVEVDYVDENGGGPLADAAVALVAVP